MQYFYGEFTEKQINEAVKSMHNDIHKLLLYKDKNIIENIFDSDQDFIRYFNNLLFRFGGFNKLLGEPPLMVNFMSTLQSAYDEANSNMFNYKKFRNAILNCHGYIRSMFEEG